MDSLHIMLVMATAIGVAYCIEWIGFQCFFKYPYRYGIPITTKLVQLTGLKKLSTLNEQIQLISGQLTDSELFTSKLSLDSKELYVRRQLKYFAIQNIGFIVGCVYFRDEWRTTIRVGAIGYLMLLFICIFALTHSLNVFDAFFIIFVFLSYIGLSIFQYLKIWNHLKARLELK